MTATLIALAPLSASSWSWALFAGEPLTVTNGEGLESAREAAKAFRSARVWIVVPGIDVASRRLRLPETGERQLRAALPFAFEDDLASDPECLHFALGAREAGAVDRLAVAVDRAKMQSWISQCHESGLRPDAMTPDYLAIDAAQGLLGLLLTGDYCVATFPNGAGFTLESDLASQILPKVAVDLGVESVELLRPEGPSARLPSWQRLSASERMSPHDSIRVMYRGLAGGMAVDMLQGAYARPRSAVGALLAWRRPVVLAASLVLLALTNMAATGWDLSMTASRELTIAESIAREALPPQTRIVNPRAQLRSAARTLEDRAVDRFLALSGIVASAVAATPGTGLESIDFVRDRPGLSLVISTSSFESLQGLGAVIRERGAILEEGESRQSADGVLAQAIVRWP